MFAIVAAVLFVIALILDIAATALGPIGPSAFIAAGLACLALQLAGVGARLGARTGGRSFRRSRMRST